MKTRFWTFYSTPSPRQRGIACGSESLSPAGRGWGWRLLATILLQLLMVSCDKYALFDGPNTFSEDFESYTQEADMFNEGRWSHIQRNLGNHIILDTTMAHSGTKCFRFEAQPSTKEGASKASIVKQKMAFWEGERVRISFWCYIKGTAPANWLFLFDLEEKVAIGAGPGMRIANVGADNQLVVEHKYPNPNIKQAEGQEISFPRDQWVQVEMETLLSQQKEGYVKVWQDGQLILEQYDWQTLPKDLIYAQQGTKAMYTNIEFGITANTRDSEMTVYLDDINVETLP